MTTNEITTRRNLIETAIINSVVFSKEDNKELSSFWLNQAIVIANGDKYLLNFMEVVTMICAVNAIGR